MGMGMGMGLLSLLLLLFFSMLGTSSSSSYNSLSSSSSDHIERGFSARPEPWSSTSVEFQSVLTDSTSTFSLGFLRCGGGDSDHHFLDLAVIHIPSSFPLWRAAPSQPCSFSWSTSTTLLFNGSLTLVDSSSSHSWSTNNTDPRGHGHGDRLTLLSSSNLQITSSSTTTSNLCWQSFDFPSDSIIQNQNFTSHSRLLSHSQQYSMKLGTNFLALFFYAAAADHIGGGGSSSNNHMIMYWKRTAMEAKAQIVDGRGPIYARLDPTGFLGLYQTEHALVDILSFDTFNAGTRKTLRRLTLESDGNLRAYYYSPNGSEWVPDFAAISSADRCSLPAACGAYGVCHMADDGGGNARCGCLDNRTATEGCYPADSGDLCGKSGFGVVRRRGVELANKLEWLERRGSSSLEECEGWCERNCSCWGALYSNTSGYCYRMDYPIHTVLAVGDQRKVGYFKVRNNIIVTSSSGSTTAGREEEDERSVVVVVLGMLILVCGCGFAGYRVWRINGNWRRRRRTGGEVDGVVPEGGMPSSSSYKPLISTSFRHIELTNSSTSKE
ncbi:PAN domain-containing protein-like [Iris pallida]|uniref:PAN domain-containing protein-like n=1 Tax=Iris pallida TaxID=29817 RepID=A0AAX6DFI9_IRIPA|nr:PAN domain-containing protein-like [Iris pallida]